MTVQDSDGLKVYDTSGPNPVLFDAAPTLTDMLSPVSPTLWTVRRSGHDAPCDRWSSTFSAAYVELPSTQLLYSELGLQHSAADPTKHYSDSTAPPAEDVGEALQLDLEMTPVPAGIIRFVYTPTVDMIADLLTKTLPLGPMQRFTRMLLNMSSTPLVPVQAGSLSSA
jgi:hypothetical protein